VSVWMPSDWVRTVRDGQHGGSTEPAPSDGTAPEAPDIGAAANGAAANGVPASGGPLENGAPANGAGPPGAPAEAAANGAAANGAPANGAASYGRPPEDGAAPNGAAPNGAAPNGAAPNGAAPNGAAPNGAATHGAPSDGAAASAAVVAANGASANGGTDGSVPAGPDVADATPAVNGVSTGSGRESDADWAYRVADELRRQAMQRGRERRQHTADEDETPADDDVSDLVAEPKPDAPAEAAVAEQAAGAPAVKAPEAEAPAAEPEVPSVPEVADATSADVAEAPASDAPEPRVSNADDTWSAIVAQAEALVREPALADDEPSGTLFSDPPRAGQMFRLGKRDEPAEDGVGGLFRPKGTGSTPAADDVAAPTASDGIDDPTVVVPLPLDPEPDNGVDDATVVLPLPDLRVGLPTRTDAPAVESTMDSAWPWFARDDEPATALAPQPPASVNGSHPEPLPRRTPKPPPADTNARTPGGPSLFEPAPRSGPVGASPLADHDGGSPDSSGLHGSDLDAGEERPPFGGDPDNTGDRLLLQRPSTTLPPAADELTPEPPNDPPLRRRPRLPDPDLASTEVDAAERDAEPAAADPAPSVVDSSGVDSPTEVISARPLAAALAGVDDPTEIVARPRFDDPPTEVISPLGIGLWQEYTGDLSGDAERAIRNAGGTPLSARVTPDSVEQARTRASRRAGSDDGDGPKSRPKDDRPPPTAGDRIRTGIRGTGQTLITLGLVVLLFVVYELWVTDLFNAHTQKKLGSTLAKEWEDGDDPLVGADGNGPAAPARPGDKVSRIPLGKGFANIYIPKFGLDYAYTIVEGTSPDDLNLGPGHYVGSALPGAVGNFAVAGHRVGKGSPFLNLDKLSAGDAIVVETKSFWYTYRVLPLTDGRGPSNFAPTGVGGIPGMEIVSPTDVNVIRPVPGSTAKATQRLITLTTCHPKFSAKQRLIIHGVQDGAPWPKSKGDPPSLKQG
jgi:sortase A